MKGSGVAASKAKSSKKPKEPTILPQQPIPVLPIGFEPDTSFDKFLELPKDVQDNIMSRGIKQSALQRPGKQLEFLLHTTPGVAINKNFLLPTEVKIIFVNGTTETKTFDKFSEYKKYFEELFENMETKKFEIIDIIHEYILLRISLFRESSEGSIHIHILSSSSRPGGGTLTLNFERVKKRNNVIMLSKVLLRVYVNSDIENLKDIFVAIGWLSLVFKEIKINKLINFDNPDNINLIYYQQGYEVKTVFSNIQPEIQQQLMLLMKYIGISLKPKRKTRLSRSVRESKR
jgi:hypothetical protein